MCDDPSVLPLFDPDHQCAFRSIKAGCFLLQVNIATRIRFGEVDCASSFFSPPLLWFFFSSIRSDFQTFAPRRSDVFCCGVGGCWDPAAEARQPSLIKLVLIRAHLFSPLLPSSFLRAVPPLVWDTVPKISLSLDDRGPPDYVSGSGKWTWTHGPFSFPDAQGGGTIFSASSRALPSAGFLGVNDYSEAVPPFYSTFRSYFPFRPATSRPSSPPLSQLSASPLLARFAALPLSFFGYRFFFLLDEDDLPEALLASFGASFQALWTALLLAKAAFLDATFAGSRILPLLCTCWAFFQRDIAVFCGVFQVHRRSCHFPTVHSAPPPRRKIP